MPRCLLLPGRRGSIDPADHRRHCSGQCASPSVFLVGVIAVATIGRVVFILVFILASAAAVPPVALFVAIVEAGAPAAAVSAVAVAVAVSTRITAAAAAAAAAVAARAGSAPCAVLVSYLDSILASQLCDRGVCVCVQLAER